MSHSADKSLAEAAALLRDARTVAVLGASDKPWKAGCYVPEYLHERGYRILPVNPARVGVTMWGERVVASLAGLVGDGDPVDIVDVFRRSQELMGHLPEILAMRPLPKVVWLQSGIRNDAFCEAIEAAGLTAVQDRCTLADHRRAGLGYVTR